ncbi:MAG: tRNA 2-thiouridine(34) synthase MnmA [Planctomycetaceae bacterium]|nr:tRNA 2-thiouridine(34) synthase MnmA [Planctomycetaceae bacterium]
MAKVLVAVSGGVDSSTTAAVLQQRGFECLGLFMVTHDRADKAQQDAEAVCRHLGVPLLIADVRREFEQVISYFVCEYKSGRTPNPCVYCNRFIKFGRLWEIAQENHCQFIATGHYARIRQVNGTACLYEADDTAKDQSYVLSMVRRQMLGHILLPMAELTKPETRKLAGQFGLPTEHKEDSQEICFIPDNDYTAMLEQWCPGILQKGKIVDTEGRELGEHEGISKFTIGQRRGLRVAMGRPMYVVRIDAETNTVVLGRKEDVMSRGLVAEQFNWLIDPPREAFEAVVKVRYNHKGDAAKVYPLPETGEVRIVFERPLSAVTPGQAAVVYLSRSDGRQIAGGGWIRQSIKEP